MTVAEFRAWLLAKHAHHASEADRLTQRAEEQGWPDLYKMAAERKAEADVIESVLLKLKEVDAETAQAARAPDAEGAKDD